MLKQIKTGIKILKEKRTKAFITSINMFLTRDIFSAFIQKLFLAKIKDDPSKIVNQIKNFNSSEPEEVFDFIQKFYFGFIKSMQIKEEFIELLKIFKTQKPKYILEIGTAGGGSLFCFCKLAPDDAIIVSIDLPDGPFGSGYPEWKIPIYQAFKKENQNLYLLREDSHRKKTFEDLLKILNGNKLDFLFIDGDHSYDGVKKDFDMYSPLVRNGGIIAFHDIAPRGEPIVSGGVPRFWKEIKSQFNYKEFIKDLDQISWGIGVIFK